jgi:hypothetical protein
MPPCASCELVVAFRLRAPRFGATGPFGPGPTGYELLASTYRLLTPTGYRLPAGKLLAA